MTVTAVSGKYLETYNIMKNNYYDINHEMWLNVLLIYLF